MKPITFLLFATLWYYFANGLEEEASTLSTFLRGGSDVKHVKLLAIEVEEEKVESSNVATNNYGNGDDRVVKLRRRQLQFLLWDGELCSINSQCSSGCCSDNYSVGVFQCTPSIYGICSAGGSGGGISLGDWAFCTTNSQCTNGCCSNQFSNDGMLKCTPGGCGCGGCGGGSGGEETPLNSPPTTSTPPNKLDIVEVIVASVGAAAAFIVPAVIYACKKRHSTSATP
jgi:hypothetical protein